MIEFIITTFRTKYTLHDDYSYTYIPLNFIEKNEDIEYLNQTENLINN